MARICSFLEKTAPARTVCLKRYSDFCVSTRCFFSYSARSRVQEDGTPPDLWRVYSEAKQRAIDASTKHPTVNAKAVFCNNETNLAKIDIYGFDYDYTLATYSDELHLLIYDLAKDVLIKRKKYPPEIRHLRYSPTFPVRGLHYDVENGFLMKLDAFHHIQLGTVYRGTHALSADETREVYNGIHVPLTQISSSYGTGVNNRTMVQMMDQFTLPEMGLLSDIADYFIAKQVPYDAEYLFQDVSSAVAECHNSGQIHKAIINDLDRYLVEPNGTAAYLERLKTAGKKLFLITNSSYAFVDRGMRHIIGHDWVDLFNIVVTDARKPTFFTDTNKPFRVINRRGEFQTFGRVESFDDGMIYQQGNLDLFIKLTGWTGMKVLYFGDHVYSDLADPTLIHGWKTAAIIPELEDEINTGNSREYRETLTWLYALQTLIEEAQIHDDPESTLTRAAWLDERNALRNKSKALFNPYFGSIFRTYDNPSYFSRRLSRFANIYMSSMCNLLQYPPTYKFYPNRVPLPHEIPMSNTKLRALFHNLPVDNNKK